GVQHPRQHPPHGAAGRQRREPRDRRRAVQQPGRVARQPAEARRRTHRDREPRSDRNPRPRQRARAPARFGLMARAPIRRIACYVALGIVLYAAFLLATAPAFWLAEGAARLTDGRITLAAPSGTLWRGSAEF